MLGQPELVVTVIEQLVGVVRAAAPQSLRQTGARAAGR
jgi:hypothetical protein